MREKDHPGADGLEGWEKRIMMDKAQPHPLFKLATELGPLVVFFIANAKFHLFVATGAFMVAVVQFHPTVLSAHRERRLMTDDWKWVLRGSSSTRPVLRFLGTDSAPQAPRPEPANALRNARDAERVRGRSSPRGQRQRGGSGRHLRAGHVGVWRRQQYPGG